MKILLLFLITSFAAAAPTVPKVTVTWDPNAPEDRVTSYKIYERVGTVYTLVATVPAPNLVAEITLFKSRQVYVATAVNSLGESGYSKGLVVLGVPNTPTNLRQ